MRKSNFTTIYGRRFQRIKSGSRFTTPVGNGYADIYKAYKKPSSEKVGIWADWKLWQSRVSCDGDAEVTDMLICAKNDSFFSISAILKVNGKKYGLRITPTYNYIWDLF